MFSGLATAILTLLLAARFCDSAAINSADGPAFGTTPATVDRCWETKEAGLTWDQFCGRVLHRRCQTAWGSEPSCGDCQEGFKDLGSAACIAFGCPAIHELVNGVLQGACQTAGNLDVCMFYCNTGFVLEGRKETTCRGTNGIFEWDYSPPECKAAHQKSCYDQYEGWKTFKDYCYELSRTCVDSPYPYEDAKCRDCLDGYVPDDWNHERCILNAIKKCTDKDADGYPLMKKCEDLKRVCWDGTAESNEVSCGGCQWGFIKDPADPENRLICLAQRKCMDMDANGVLLMNKCEYLRRVCKDGTSESNEVTCGECQWGFMKDPADSEDRLSCIAERCSDVDKAEWEKNCKDSENKMCQDGEGNSGPKCICKSWFKEDGIGGCVAAKCTDWKDDTGATWNLFCQMQENRECLEGTSSGQPTRCSCKAGCKEKGDGTCVCEDICDQKDKHRYLLKGFFSVLLERQ